MGRIIIRMIMIGSVRAAASRLTLSVLQRTSVSKRSTARASRVKTNSPSRAFRAGLSRRSSTS